MSVKHKATLVGPQLGSHGLCSCGRVIYRAEPSRSRVDSHVVAQGGWRHVSDPTSTMVPAALRKPQCGDRPGPDPCRLVEGHTGEHRSWGGWWPA